MFSRLRQLFVSFNHAVVSSIPSTEQVKNAYHAFANGLFETGEQSVRFVKYMMGVTPERGSFQIVCDWGREFIQGFLRFSDIFYRPRKQAITQGKEGENATRIGTSRVMFVSFKKVIKVAGIVVAYNVFKAITLSVLYGREDQSKEHASSYLESSVSFAVSVPVTLCAIRLFLDTTLASVANNLSLANTVAAENPIPPRKDLKECDTLMNSYMADMIALIEYWMVLLTANQLPSSIGMLVRILNDGRYLSAAQFPGKCRKDRLEESAYNKAYMAGRGASLYILAGLIKKGIDDTIRFSLSNIGVSHYGGVDGLVFNAALTTLLGQLNTIAEQKNRDPGVLPGQGKGKTWALIPGFLPEILTVLGLTSGLSFVFKSSEKQYSSVDPLPVLKFPPVVLALKLLADDIPAIRFYFMDPLTKENIHVFNKFNQREEMRIFIRLYAEMLQGLFEEILKKTDMTVAQAAAAVFNCMSWVSPSFTKWVVTEALGLNGEMLALGVRLMDSDVRGRIQRTIVFLKKLAAGVPLDESDLPKVTVAGSAPVFNSDHDGTQVPRPPAPPSTVWVKNLWPQTAAAPDPAAGVSSDSLPSAPSPEPAPAPEPAPPATTAPVVTVPPAPPRPQAPVLFQDYTASQRPRSSVYVRRATGGAPAKSAARSLAPQSQPGK